MPERGSQFNPDFLIFPLIDEDFIEGIFNSLSNLNQHEGRPPVIFLALRELFCANANEWISLTNLERKFEKRKNPRVSALSGMNALDAVLKLEDKPVEVVSINLNDRNGSEKYYRLRKLS